MYTVRQTDCRTGWQVVDSAGKVYLTFRRRESASECAAELNAGR